MRALSVAPPAVFGRQENLSSQERMLYWLGILGAVVGLVSIFLYGQMSQSERDAAAMSPLFSPIVRQRLRAVYGYGSVCCCLLLPLLWFHGDIAACSAGWPWPNGSVSSGRYSEWPGVEGGQCQPMGVNVAVFGGHNRQHAVRDGPACR